LSGCAQKDISITSQGPLTSQEQQWLAKAYRQDVNGWIYLHIEGKPFERGFQRGYLIANEIDEFRKTLAHIAYYQTGKEYNYFVESAAKLFKNKISPEYTEEMNGTAAGMNKAGKKVTGGEILFMNGFIDILWYWWPQHKSAEESTRPGCSAFIATGDATADGKIVMTHNTWINYAMGRFCNIVVDIAPEKGHRILMQSFGPCIYSATDFFITDVGLVGTETTIGNFKGFDKNGTPVFERARKAMQYAETIDEWADIMIKKNNGAYANSWLLGDINTGEIARLELGLKSHNLEKKTSGYFAGSNITSDIKLLRQETDASLDDIRNNCVTRNVRWKQLIRENYGKIDTELAKKMLADHYDVYREQEKPSSRTICGHSDLDDGSIPGTKSAFRPVGAVDGKVIDSDMAKNWQFVAKWGSSCDISFDAKKFLEKHPQYDWLDGFLKDLPAQPWITLPPKK
jgi:hypothetical protein